MYRIAVRCLVIIMLLLPAAPAWSASATDAIRGPINEIVAILKDPIFKDPAQKAQQRQQMWSVVGNLFDFTEISRRSLGANWKRFNPQQKETFTDLFGRLLGDTYLGKIQGGYENEKVEIRGEEAMKANRSRVRTFIIRDGVKIPVDYSLKQKDGIWRVYDIKVEGISLIRNYRSQFDQLLVKNSPDQLIEKIRAKVSR